VLLRKTVSGIMLILTLIGVLILAFNIQPVRLRATTVFYGDFNGVHSCLFLKPPLTNVTTIQSKENLFSEWPMFHHDATNTGYTTDLVLPPLVLNWTFDTDGEQVGYGVISSPAIANGVVYIGSDDNNIYALNATNGLLIWKYRTDDWVRSTPAVVNQVVYVAAQDGYIYALYAKNGTLKWKYGPAGGFQLSSPTVKDGRLYVASVPTFAPGGPSLIALNIEDGTLEWETPLSSQSTPAVANGIVYIGSDKVYALNATDGSIMWQYDYYDPVNDQDEFFNTSPAVANGIVYIASGYISGRIHALNATTGKLIWMYESGYPSFSSPAIAHGMVYIGSYTDYNVYALDAQTGTLTWKYHTQGEIDYSSPAIADKVVYVCSNDGYLYALNATSGFAMARYPVVGGTSPAIAEDKIFVGSHDGNIYCLAAARDSIPPNPIASFTYSPSDVIAHETLVLFNASISESPNGTITDYYWDFGDGTYVYSPLATTTHIFNSYGNYNVTLTVFSDSGLASTQTQLITVTETPIAIFTFSPEIYILVGCLTTFNASMSNPRGGTITAYIWDFGDGNITSTAVPIVVHTYAFPGRLNVTLTVLDSEGLNSSCSRMISAMTPTFISISTSSSSTYVGFKVNITGTLRDIYGNGLENETVVLYYTFSGISTWTPITSDVTDNLGRYHAVWTPPATGYFTIKAEWNGNTTHLETSNTTTLSSLTYDNQYVFSVESNSTIQELAFNTTNWQLSFAATGPNGTEGYVKVTVAKSLVENITNIRVYLDGNQTEYSITSIDNSWLLTFNYMHSTHQVVVDLDINIIPEFPLAIILALFMILTTLAVALVKKSFSKN